MDRGQEYRCFVQKFGCTYPSAEEKLGLTGASFADAWPATPSQPPPATPPRVKGAVMLGILVLSMTVTSCLRQHVAGAEPWL